MPNVLDSRGFRFRYSSGIAPLITTSEYADLIKNYKATGQFPHILKLGGMAIDTSRNRNKWRVPMDDLQAIADQLKGAPLMKDHDIDHVDSIIGKVEESWVEADKDDPSAGKVLWAGETSDESLIQKILLGYVRFNSIQIAVPQAYCDNCMTANGKSEEQAAIDNLDLPCPRCGSLDMLIRHPMVLEQSMVAIPAYEKAEVTPHGFKASLDLQLQKRFERANQPKVVQPPQPDLLPMLIAAYNGVNEIALSALEMQLRMAKMAMEETDSNVKCPVCGRNDVVSHSNICYSEFMNNPDKYKTEEEVKGGSLEDFPLIQKGKKEGYEEEEMPKRCVNCGSTSVPYQVGYADGTGKNVYKCTNCGYDFNTKQVSREEEVGEDDDEDAGLSCSKCGGSLVELGNLGNKTWYRCRNCGSEEARTGIQ